MNFIIYIYIYIYVCTQLVVYYQLYKKNNLLKFKNKLSKILKLKNLVSHEIIVFRTEIRRHLGFKYFFITKKLEINKLL